MDLGKWKENWDREYRYYAVTIGFAAANLLIFLCLELIGDTEDSEFMIAHGAMYPPLIREGGEYYRMLTATFLHFGLSHLVGNLLVLVSAGRILETAIGHVRFFLLYLLAGLGGSFLSYLQMLHSGDYAVSAGASGAIFGIIGALLWIVIIHRGHYGTLTIRGLLFMIAVSLYYGIVSGGVDNWGHIGGLIGGFVFGIIFYRRNGQTY